MFEDKQTAIETLCMSGIVATPAVPLIFENMASPDDGEFIRVSVLFGDSQRMQIGGHAYRYYGVVAVQIFQKEGVGINRGVVLADIVSTVFRDVIDTGINFQVPYVTKVPFTSEGWFQVQVTVPFYFDEVSI